MEWLDIKSTHTFYMVFCVKKRRHRAITLHGGLVTLKDLESDYASAPSDCTKPGVLARFTRRYNLPLAALSALIALAALFLSAGPAAA